MHVQPATDEEVSATRDSLISYLVIALCVTVLVFFFFSWMDARKVPTITYTSTPKAQIAVDVRGAILTPGVIYLPPGARMIDVINTSGGMSPEADASLVNLSSRVMDGQMVVIPTRAAEPDDSQASGLININSASVEELKNLPGIGDVLAQRIVAHREANGPFQSTEELKEVEGISSSVAETLEPLTTVSGND